MDYMFLLVFPVDSAQLLRRIFHQVVTFDRSGGYWGKTRIILRVTLARLHAKSGG